MTSSKKLTRIDSLTPEQQARFGEWSKKWIDIGLSTEPADFEAATDSALRAYELCGLKKPMVVLRMSSPYAATIGGFMAWKMLRGLPGSQVWNQVGAQVRDQVWNQVWDQVEEQVGAQVRTQVWNQVKKQTETSIFQSAKDGLYNDGASNLGWANFAAWVSFFRDVCGWKNEVLAKFEIAETLVKSCGWTWWHQNVLAISDRPCLLKRDDAGRLHCENGPSIAYRDGWALHHWHGVSIPAEWVEGKKPTAQEALTWANIEQRRAACEIVGWANVLDQLKAKVIDEDSDPEIGTLLEVDLPDSGKERFLKVLCGTKRVFALPVPTETNSAIEAQAWTWGLDPKEFQRPEIRT